MGVTLAAIADNADRLTFEEADIAILFVVTLCHLFENSVRFDFDFQILLNRGSQLELLRFERYRNQAGASDLNVPITLHDFNELVELFRIASGFESKAFSGAVNGAGPENLSFLED